MKTAAEMNKANLSYLSSTESLAEKKREYWEKISTGEILYYSGYNAKRGTQSFYTLAGGKAERVYLNRVMKAKNSPVANTKPISSMTGFSF